jgi:hypothetical protein
VYNLTGREINKVSIGKSNVHKNIGAPQNGISLVKIRAGSSY